MKKVFISIMLLLMSPIVSADASKQICDELKQSMAQMQEQLPMVIDPVTDWIGIQTIYIGNTCLINYNYSVNIDKYARDFAGENDLSVEEYMKFLSSPDGHEALKVVFDDIAKGAAKLAFTTISNEKNIKVTYHYSFSNVDIDPIVATGLDTTVEL